MDRNGSVMAPGRSTAVLVCRERAEYVNRMDQPEGRQKRRWKSDSLVVLRVRESRAHGEAARQVELLVQGNIPCTLRGRRRMSTQLDQIAKKAKSNPKLRFTSLAHLLTPEFLTETWKQMNRRGASGVDGETTKEFEQDLDTRVQELSERLKRGAYRAPPVRRLQIRSSCA